MSSCVMSGKSSSPTVSWFVAIMASTYRGQQFLAGEMCLHIVDHQLAHRGSRLVRRARLMRLQHDVFHGEERLWRARLVGEDIEPCAGDDAILQRFHQCR